MKGPGVFNPPRAGRGTFCWGRMRGRTFSLGKKRFPPNPPSKRNFWEPPKGVSLQEGRQAPPCRCRRLEAPEGQGAGKASTHHFFSRLKPANAGEGGTSSSLAPPEGLEPALGQGAGAAPGSHFFRRLEPTNVGEGGTSSSLAPPEGLEPALGQRVGAALGSHFFRRLKPTKWVGDGEVGEEG